MLVWRHEHMDGVQALRLEHRVQIRVGRGNAEARGEPSRALCVLIADREKFDARHRAKSFCVPVGDVTSPKKADLERCSHNSLRVGASDARSIAWSSRAAPVV